MPSRGVVHFGDPYEPLCLVSGRFQYHAWSTWDPDKTTCKRCVYRIKNPRPGPPRTPAERILMRRRFWLPKHPEVKVACASCPFRVGNEAEFGAIVEQLSTACGKPVPESERARAAVTEIAREKIRREVRECGDFVCHLSVYRDGCKTKSPESEWRQCAGATLFFRTGEQIEVPQGE